MRSAWLAEWILSLVTSPDRASATIGDLTESIDASGVFWFWSSVAQTAGSLLWRDLTVNPARMIGLAAMGLIVELGLFLLYFAALFFVAFIVLFAVALLVPGALSGFQQMPVSSKIARLCGELGGSVLVVLVPFMVGRFLARRAPGQEMAACLATTILWAIACTAVEMELTRSAGARIDFAQTLLGLTVYQIPTFVPLAAGAAWVRRRTLAA